MQLNEIVIYGDSISTGAHGGGGYLAALEATFSATLHNHSIPASGLSTATPNNLVTRLQQPGMLHPDAQLILLWLGTNDWYWGAELGSFAEHTPETFCGAMALVLAQLQHACPQALILWPTPIWRMEQPHECPIRGEGWVTANRSGHTLGDFTVAIQSGATQFGFTAPEMRSKTGFHAANADQMLEDGVHPSRTGYARIAQVLCRSIEALPLL